MNTFDHILNTATLFQFDLFKMDHKRDATSAGLPWPALQPRQPASKPAPRLPPGTTSPPTSSASSAAPTPMGNTPPFAAIEPTAPASYSADPPQLGAPFPPPNITTTPNVFYGHQVYFKIFSFDNQRRALWVTEINHQGFARTREPESYFYFLTHRTIGDPSSTFQLDTSKTPTIMVTDAFRHLHLHCLFLHQASQLWQLNFMNDFSHHLHRGQGQQSLRVN